MLYVMILIGWLTVTSKHFHVLIITEKCHKSDWILWEYFPQNSQLSPSIILFMHLSLQSLCCSFSRTIQSFLSVAQLPSSSFDCYISQYWVLRSTDGSLSVIFELKNSTFLMIFSFRVLRVLWIPQTTVKCILIIALTYTIVWQCVQKFDALMLIKYHMKLVEDKWGTSSMTL
jgi:hypothetical protein